MQLHSRAPKRNNFKGISIKADFRRCGAKEYPIRTDTVALMLLPTLIQMELRCSKSKIIQSKKLAKNLKNAFQKFPIFLVATYLLLLSFKQLTICE
jgi:hypothetical protein